MNEAKYPDVLPNGNQAACPTCGRLFVSDRAFDDHRRGPIGSRRCDVSGMELNDKGLYLRKP